MMRWAAISSTSRNTGRLSLYLLACVGVIIAESANGLTDEFNSAKADAAKVQPVVEAYRRAKAATPVPQGIHLQFGIRLWELGDIVESRLAFQREVAADPANLSARAMLGIIQVQERKYSEAAAELAALIEKDPALTQIWHPLGRARFEMGMFEEAKRCLEKAAAAKPGVPQIESLLAKTYARLSDAPNAKRVSVLYAKSRKLQQARELATARKWDEALQLISQYLAAFPTSSEGLYVKAGILFNGFRSLDGAIDSARASIANNSANMDARNLLAVLLLAKGDSMGFQREMRDLIGLDPFDARAHYYLGRFESDSGRLADARQHLERARLMQPNDALIGIALAGTYEKLGMKEQAEAEYKKDVDVARNQPPDGSTYTHYAAFLLNEGRIPEAIRYLDQATELPAARAEAWYLAGMAHLKNGETEQARLLLRKAIERRANYAEARSALASIGKEDGR